MEERYPKNLVSKFFDDTAVSYDAVVFWATFGQDLLWKKEIIKRMSLGDSFLDLACGTGILTRKIAAKFPGSIIVGVDISKSYLDLAVKNSTHFKNIEYIHDDVEKLELDMKFDCITSSYVPKYCDSKKLIEMCIRHLKPGGKIILHDFTYPENFSVQKLWDCYFLFLQGIGIFLPSWRTAFRELPKVIKKSTWETDLCDELSSRGMIVKKERFSFDSSSIVSATLVS